jgi:integrase
VSKRANGDGSIYQRSDGRWCGAYYVPDGKGGETRKYVYGKDRDEVRVKLTEVVRAVDRGMPVPVGSPKLADCLTDWLTNVVVHKVRSNTLASYATNVRLHIVPRVGNRRLDKLTPKDVRAMLDAMRKGGAGARLIQHTHATLRAALQHGFREELVSRNVAQLVQVPRPEKKRRQALSADDAKKLLKVAADDRLATLIVVTLLLGMRRSEALALFWSDIDLDEGTLQIRRTLHRVDGRLVFLPPKTRDSDRTVPLPPMVARALRQHRERQETERAASELPWPDGELVFTTPAGEPIKPWNFTRMFGRLCDRAGVPRSRLHDLRHTCVSLLLALGVPPRVVMEIVGHSTIEMTMTVYGHVSLDTQRDALGKLDDLLGEE